jgi:hypothetical protein
MVNGKCQMSRAISSGLIDFCTEGDPPRPRSTGTPPELVLGTAMADLATETIAERLRDHAARSAALTALESHAVPIPTSVSLAAAPALVGALVPAAGRASALAKTPAIPLTRAPASTPAPAPVPARVGTPERAVRPDHSFTPSVQMTPRSLSSAQELLQPPGSSTDTAVILQHDVVSIKFMREEREHLKLELNEQHKEMQARIDAKDAKLEELAKDAVHQRDVASAKSCVSEGQLELLQTRLDALHQAKLLSDDEIGALEDCISDYIECRSSLSVAPAELSLAAEKMTVMVGLSEGMGKDRMLARQLRRKFAAA